MSDLVKGRKKDVEPEMLSLIVPNIDVQTTRKAWQGKATNITIQPMMTVCYSRKLAHYSIYPHGCVIWAITHIQMQKTA